MLRFSLSACLIHLSLAACSAGGDTTAEDAGGDGDASPAASGGDASGSGAAPGSTGGDSAGTGAAPAGTGGEGATGGSGAEGSATGGVGTGSGGTDPGLPPLEECASPSIDRFQEWLASGEGPTVPATGSLLVADGDGYVAQASFTGATQWHVLAVWFGNEYGASIDLSESSGFTLTYSATADFYFQLRPAAEWSGGNKWHMTIPSTNGEVMTSTFSFDPSGWEERLGPPPHTMEEALADASGFAIVGNTTNELAFHGLRIDGFVPDCMTP